MDTALSGRAAIVGIGQTEFSRGAGRSVNQLAAEAAIAAISRRGDRRIHGRRHGHVLRGRYRRPAAHPQHRRRRAALDVAHARRGRRVVRGHPARRRGSCGRRRRPRARVPLAHAGDRPHAPARPDPIRRRWPDAGVPRAVRAVRPPGPRAHLLAVVPALHVPLRSHQRRLRPLLGGRTHGTPPPTPRPTSTGGRSRSRTTRARGGSSSRSCGCSTAARPTTARSP